VRNRRRVRVQATFYLMTDAGCVKWSHICYVSPHPVLGLSATPQRTLSSCPNKGDALRERASSTHRQARCPIWPLPSRACQHSTPDSGQPLALPQLSLAASWPQGPLTSYKWLCACSRFVHTASSHASMTHTSQRSNIL
jgi:hypothetical protein